MKPSTPSLFRVVREADEPIPLFFRPGKDDHTVVERILVDERVGMLGVVFDASCSAIHEELREEILTRQLDAVLDPEMMELATQAGHTSARSLLPWAAPTPDVPSDFNATRYEKVAAQIAQLVKEKGFSAVLAPSHYLEAGTKDSWFAIDRRIVFNLRQRLDSAGCGNVRIYYPLAIPTRLFTNPAARTSIIASLTGLPVNAIWLRIHPFGSHSSDAVLHRCIVACQDLHRLRLPLVAEKTGVLALALLAFGAVTGIESGISSGERFDFGRLKRTRAKKGPFRKTARIYFSDLGEFLTRKQAMAFFENRGLRRYGCLDTDCCRHGPDSMIKDPRRHFANRRMGEVALLSRVTPSRRAVEYLEQILRPATDNMGRVLAVGELPDVVRQRLENSRRKQDRWRDTLGKLSRSPIPSFSPPLERWINKKRQTA